MRDERQWVPVEVIWDREARTPQAPARGFPWPQGVAPSPTERPRPVRLAPPPPPQRHEARDDEPAPRRRKGAGKRRGNRSRRYDPDDE